MLSYGLLKYVFFLSVSVSFCIMIIYDPQKVTFFRFSEIFTPDP